MCTNDSCVFKVILRSFGAFAAFSKLSNSQTAGCRAKWLKYFHLWGNYVVHIGLFSLLNVRGQSEVIQCIPISKMVAHRTKRTTIWPSGRGGDTYCMQGAITGTFWVPVHFRFSATIYLEKASCGGKRSELWDSLVYFDLVVFKVILGSFAAFVSKRSVTVNLKTASRGEF